jgi:hypothetical protein
LRNLLAKLCYLFNAVIGQAGFAGYRGSATVPAGGQVPATGATFGQGRGRHLLHRLSGAPGLSSVPLHNGGFCNGCVTKRCEMCHIMILFHH